MFRKRKQEKRVMKSQGFLLRVQLGKQSPVLCSQNGSRRHYPAERPKFFITVNKTSTNFTNQNANSCHEITFATCLFRIKGDKHPQGPTSSGKGASMGRQHAPPWTASTYTSSWASVWSVSPSYSQKCLCLQWIVVMAAQLQEFAKNHSVTYLPWANFMVCKLHLNKVVS